MGSNSGWVVPYLLCVLLTGVGYIALLPPFEGFDEFAHYSSVRQVADTATIPRYGSSFLDKAVMEYRGPMPYGSGAVPFRPLHGGRAYPEFFSDESAVRGYITDYSDGAPGPFAPSQRLNWQAQHPPLYYLLMAPVMWMTRGMSFLSQVLALRLVSYLLAMSGVLYGLSAVRKGPSGNPAAALGFLWYPVILPEFFPEFARIGNDSLCLLLLGCLLYLVAGLNPSRPINRPWLIGSILGLGLLTKAFFLPVTAGVIAWLVLCRLKWGTGTIVERITGMRDVVAVIACAMIIGGWWYAINFFVFGEVSGGDQAIRLLGSGGLAAGLEQNVSLWRVVRGLVTIPVTWVWTGAWSLARLPGVVQAPLVILACWVTAEFLVRVRWNTLQTVDGLTLLMVGAMCAGLAHRTLQGIAAAGNGNQGGWYLHIFMPWVALALGAAIQTILHRPITRRLFLGLACYTLAFDLAILWAEAALFSGCATKGDDKLFHFSTHAYCLDEVSMVFDRLRVVAWPGVAVVAFSAALACGLWTVYVVWNSRNLARTA